MPGWRASCRVSDLFLIDAVAGNAKFDQAVPVAEGFPGYSLPVPHPDADGRLYLKLRDDPSIVNVVSLQAQEVSQAP